MNDREKVIKGLEVCIPIEEGETCPSECPYYLCHGYSQLMRDALALLKEQEAHVLTLDEVAELIKAQKPRVLTADEIQENELVWIEVPQSDEIWPALLREKDWFDHPTWVMRGYAIARSFLHDGYGRDWRCWTAKPTEDQRLAVKWDD